MMSTVYSACITAQITLIQSCLPVMTWDALGLDDVWVAAAEVVATEEIMKEQFLPVATWGTHKESCNSPPLLLQNDHRWC